ncbi:acyl-CoA thioester hydrolase/BAAT C-terminal domain-containing protein [Clostridium estertheticum]|uniref:acyl-CoA thioester hydrolase/BAAT C-terminal domain-containing protein n=2 Tax=Clostridium estertheticum TaxID=238834 RepID=UPI00217DEE98|nr:acyl-CoA thioester hydrolase/BAAT C-terminal domain-containing protein [Clostridium estertheticum]
MFNCTINSINFIYKLKWTSLTIDERLTSNLKDMIDKNAMKEAEKKNYCKCYEMSIENNLNKDALININNYKGKILLLSAENDNYWPSKKMSNMLVKNSNNKENINHIVLELEGHYFLSLVFNPTLKSYFILE